MAFGLVQFGEQFVSFGVRLDAQEHRRGNGRRLRINRRVRYANEHDVVLADPLRRQLRHQQDVEQDVAERRFGADHQLPLVTVHLLEEERAHALFRIAAVLLVEELTSAKKTWRVVSESLDYNVTCDNAT